MLSRRALFSLLAVPLLAPLACLASKLSRSGGTPGKPRWGRDPHKAERVKRKPSVPLSEMPSRWNEYWAIHGPERTPSLPFSAGGLRRNPHRMIEEFPVRMKDFYADLTLDGNEIRRA
jgi:hypothetical protein